MTGVGLPNPGYPAPHGMRVHLVGGTVIPAGCRYVDTVLDAGVPTPRFELVLPDGLDISSFVVDHLEGNIPPGTIVMFGQAGNAVENAEGIVTRSRRAEFKRVVMSRKDIRGH